uniref:PGG domain-containing protein n=1 Tax=Heterorhabditis bacteriophora TaxID=37862 RepID=A0A1I7X3R9_HETBA
MATIYTKFSGGSSDYTDESVISASPQPKRKEKEDKNEATQYFYDMKSDPAMATLFKEKDRKLSTGTLNRLILVAQALESEVDSRRQTEISGGKITFSIRMANMILLVLVNVLIFTGFGKYQAHRDGGYKDLLLTADKWKFDINSSDFPPTFSLMQLNGQYLAAAIAVFLLCSTLCLQIIHICNSPSSRITLQSSSIFSTLASLSLNISISCAISPFIRDNEANQRCGHKAFVDGAYYWSLECGH